jgi:hypothetical protein
MMAAYILGGLSTSTLISLVGTTNLLFISGICLVLYTGVLVWAMPRLNIQRSAPESGTQRITLREMFADRYIVLLFVLKTVSMLAGYIIEYIFYAQAAFCLPCSSKRPSRDNLQACRSRHRPFLTLNF